MAERMSSLLRSLVIALGLLLGSGAPGLVALAGADACEAGCRDAVESASPLAAQDALAVDHDDHEGQEDPVCPVRCVCACPAGVCAVLSPEAAGGSHVRVSSVTLRPTGRDALGTSMRVFQPPRSS